MTGSDAIALAERVEAWQERLGPLGVGAFKFKVTTSDTVPGTSGSDACVRVSENYDTCQFFFANDFADEASDEELDTTIIHEWLHVLFRDFDNAIELVEPWMPHATYDTFSENIRQRRESVIERLARALYAFYA